MIQANEKLLPGNVVMWHDRPYTLDAKDIWHISIDIKSFRNTLSPIPLTPEVLVGWCGFEKNYYYYYIKSGQIKIAIDFDNANASIWQGEGNVINIVRPEYLHTLQNLIYFLTGEELVVTIPSSTK